MSSLQPAPPPPCVSAVVPGLAAASSKFCSIEGDDDADADAAASSSAAAYDDDDCHDDDDAFCFNSARHEHHRGDRRPSLVSPYPPSSACHDPPSITLQAHALSAPPHEFYFDNVFTGDMKSTAFST